MMSAANLAGDPVPSLALNPATRKTVRVVTKGRREKKKSEKIRGAKKTAKEMIVSSVKIDSIMRIAREKRN